MEAETKPTLLTTTKQQRIFFTTIIAQDLKLQLFFNNLDKAGLSYDNYFIPNTINIILEYHGIKNASLQDTIIETFYTDITNVDDIDQQAEGIYTAIIQAQAFVLAIEGSN